MKTFDVMSHNVDKIRAELQKLARKAAKHGLAGISFVISSEPTGLRNVESDGRTFQVPTHEVTVAGTAPRIEGWDLVAILDHFQSGTIIRSVDKTEIPDIYRTRITCDHCQTNRKRNDTFLLRNDEGSLLQVGRQCLKDFTGHASPEAIVSFYKDLLVLRAGESGSKVPRAAVGMPLEEFLAKTSAVVRKYGYVSRTNAGTGEPPTADRVLAGQGVEDEEDQAMARTVLAWLDGQRENSDFMYNLKTVARNNIVTSKVAGLASAILGCYLRNNRSSGNDHLGAVGETLKTTVKVLSNRMLDGAYPSQLVKMEDRDGNLLTWFASIGGHAVQKMQAGSILGIEGKVKRHSAYKGRNETILSHVAVG